MVDEVSQKKRRSPVKRTILDQAHRSHRRVTIEPMHNQRFYDSPGEMSTITDTSYKNRVVVVFS